MAVKSMSGSEERVALRDAGESEGDTVGDKQDTGQGQVESSAVKLGAGEGEEQKNKNMVDQLTEERLANVREVFSLYDKDNDGAIPTGIIIYVLRSLGYNPAEKDVRDLIEEFDPEGDAMMEFTTFVELMLKVKREGETEEEMEEAFMVFDPPASGTISAVELRQIMTNMGEKLTEEEADDMIAFADTAGKGEINYRELIKTLLNDD